jgi:RNA polymerase sigma-70 factor (ECF subfamily)
VRGGAIMSIAELHRREYGHILASLIRVVRDISLAEDALQEAFAAALEQWPQTGQPHNPVAWLMRAARNKAIDQIRRSVMAEQKRDEIAAAIAPEEDAPVPLDSLRLIFTCCHPVLAPEAQIALTLRTVCGLSTEEIARAFVVPVATLAQRIVRAKAKIKSARIPYEVPADEELAARLDGALAVVYLVFNEGYAASFGSDLVRADLCAEAIRLGRELVALLPEEREPKGLLALMLYNDARRATRTDDAGELVLLEHQDRSLWDRERIAEANALLDDALGAARAGIRNGAGRSAHSGTRNGAGRSARAGTRNGAGHSARAGTRNGAGRPAHSATHSANGRESSAPGSYSVQAAIAALHAGAPSFEQTDWAQIAGLYGVLARLHPSPIVELNRAVAIAMAEGPERGLALLDAIELPGYHLLPAARADLQRRMGRFPDAAESYRSALALVNNDAERRYLERRLAEVEGDG